MTVDEILAALSDVGLRLWMLDQTTEHSWHAALVEDKHPGTTRFEGTGGTPVIALVAALKEAGVNIDD